MVKPYDGLTRSRGFGLTNDPRPSLYEDYTCRRFARCILTGCYVQVILNRLNRERHIIRPFHSRTDSGNIINGALDTTPTVIPRAGPYEFNEHGFLPPFKTWCRLGLSHPRLLVECRVSCFSVYLAAGLLLDEGGRTNLDFWQTYVNPLIHRRKCFTIWELIRQWYWLSIRAGAYLGHPINHDLGATPPP